MPGRNYVDSGSLATFRSILELNPELKKLIGSIAQFKLVIDANMAVRDLIHKFECPNVRLTSIEEVTKSSVVALYAPTWLDEEMVNSTIPQVSRKRGIPEPALLEIWEEYKQRIIWDDSFSVPGDGAGYEGDAKDIPYVALQKGIEAAAVLSGDRDIEKLGGKRIDLQFIIYVRAYARAKSTSVGIRLGGTFIANVSVQAFVQLIKGLGSLIVRLPDKAKITLLILAIVIMVHPKSREWILDCFCGLGETIVGVWPQVEKLIEHVSEKQLEADTALHDAEQLLGS